VDAQTGQNAIEGRILAYIAAEFLRGTSLTVGPDDNLLTAGYIDSVGVMRLIAHLESTFALAIPPADLVPQNFRTVRIMASYLSRRGARVASNGEPDRR
jgi:acyl carrier protein